MMKNREKLVRDLVNTFNDREELHCAYKKKMEEIIFVAIHKFLTKLEEDGDSELSEWIHEFVEETFRPQI